MDRRLLEEAWPADVPPAGFAERVVERARAEQRPPKKNRRRWAVAGLFLAAAAALIFWLEHPMLSTGDRVAVERSEVELGTRGVAVMEPGAHVAWSGSVITQDRGDVFYRVEPGGPFVVKTPVGDVSVLGTCFRVRAGSVAVKGANEVKRKEVAVAAGSAALAALAVVTVYEGKVQLSHAGEKLELRAGESGKSGVDGLKRVEGEELGEAERALAEPKDGALANANESLARDIADLNRKLKGLEKEKGKLEGQLASAESELAKRTDGGAARGRNEFDLDQNDWAELAKDGTVKYRHPCFKPDGWKPNADKLDELGLSPDDVEPISNAYKHSYERAWKTIGPLCTKVIGNADVAELLGPDTCTHVIVDAERKKNGSDVNEAMRQLAETRAGLRPPPAPGAPTNPVFELFWNLTGATSAFESELGQSFGPEEAKRLAYAKGMCGGESTFGGPGPREPAK